ncbi:MAG: recombination mediator RecR [Muribaculaceae bacterium]|nr:recombination protein RecR [Bacteroidales bacterium]MDE6242727.1 recombination mediator RecR [Muribaculaceae bacterium]
MNDSFNSPLLDDAVRQLGRLPGIGRKTALRLALHILRQEPSMADELAGAITRLRHEMQYCRRCHNVSDSELCPICSSPSRDELTVCVVENVKDVLTVESTGQHRGLYHVLGGLISPIDGIGPADLEIDSLVERVKAEGVKEVILALSPTMEGDTTNFYIFRRLQELPVKVTMLARGLSVGSDLEFTDELTLGRSIQQRILFSSTFANA